MGLGRMENSQYFPQVLLSQSLGYRQSIFHLNQYAKPVDEADVWASPPNEKWSLVFFFLFITL